jgi:hypothetical protein
MTLAVAGKGHERLALAAGSRATAEINLANGQRDTTYFDNATKLSGGSGQQWPASAAGCLAGSGFGKPGSAADGG